MLVLKNVRKNFWDLKAVDNISFEIKDGEIVSLIGSNGAGKTTLVNLISGYLKPDSGTILFEDRDISQEPPYTRIHLGIGRSFQIIHLFENLSVLDNVRTPLFSKYGFIRRWLLPAARYKKITEEALTILEQFSSHRQEGLLSQGTFRRRPKNPGYRGGLRLEIQAAVAG